MVSGVLSLTRNGLRDWIVQRVTSVVLGFYFLFLLGYFIAHPGLVYTQWLGLFQHAGFRIFSLLALISLVLHAWIGIWTVVTDYLKPVWLRGGVQVIVIVGLVLCLLVGIEIIWGIF